MKSFDVRLTYQVGVPFPVTGVQFGMRIEFGYDCLIPADFNNDVSNTTSFCIKTAMQCRHLEQNILMVQKTFKLYNSNTS